MTTSLTLNTIEPNQPAILCSGIPPYVGSWKMPDAPVYFSTTSKPNILVRLFNKVLLGWTWKPL